MTWSRLKYTSEAEIRNSLSDLSTVAANDFNGDGRVWGTAFPVLSSAQNILMLTAQHVIEGAYYESKEYKTLSRRGSLDYLPGPNNSKWENIFNWVNQGNKLWCLVSDGKKVTQCFVKGVSLRPPLDMALMVVDATNLQAPFPVFQLNSDTLKVGDQVVATSLITTLTDNGSTRDLIARIGSVLEVRSTGNLVNAPVYRTSIPIEAGASGGPVFKYNGNFDGAKDVIGVISSDMSSDDSFTDENVSGSSYISTIGSACPLQVTSHSDGAAITFKELCDSGKIRDIGSCIRAVKLIYQDDGKWSQQIPVTPAEDTEVEQHT